MSVVEADFTQTETHEASGPYGLRIGGIDLGKRRIALVTFEVNGDEIEVVDLTEVILRVGSRSRELELVALADSAMEVCMDQEWSQAFVEEPLVGRSVTASMALAESAGAVRAALWSTQVTMVNVRVWKSEVVGNGGAGKDLVRSYVDENHPAYASWCDSQDAYDAVCIGYYGALTSVVHGASTRT